MIRLSNTNLNQSFNIITPNHHNNADHTLLTFKRQSFKLSKQMNNHLQHRTTDHDLDQDLDNNIANNNNNNNDDFEKAFNDFYINNKIEKPNNINNNNNEEEDIKIRSKAKPRRSLFKMLFQSKSDETSHRFRLFKNRSKLIIHNNNNNYDDYFDYGSNLKNINLDLVENEFKKHSVKDIIYLKLNKSLFNLNQNNKLSNTAAFIDVTIERLQQTNKNMHLLTLNLKNLKVEPLFEINHVKSKLSYFKINLCDSDEISNECINDSKTQYHLNNTNNNLAYYNYDSNRKNFLRIHRIKRCKLKFNANNKSLQKLIDFELDDEHFMQVNSEATFLITKQQPNITNNNSSNDPIYLFLLSIELHSYLPVSRLKLSSTFSKKKKMFQGVCRINENFILNTQFNKKIDLHEI